jgi:cobalt-precorrin 5A hydrolase
MIALITLSRPGAQIAHCLAKAMDGCRIYLHHGVGPEWAGQRFDRTLDLTAELFGRSEALVFIAPCGVAVRAVAPHIRHKLSDPAVVVVDAGARQVISLLGGHEGGANRLALTIANVLDAEPVITTTSEAVRDIIVGIGCRRGAPAADIVHAVRSVLEEESIDLERVRYLATADIKRDEPGVIQAARQLGLALRFISSERIRASGRAFARSAFVAAKIGLPAVAEPAALLAGWRTSFLRRKTIINHVTVAVAGESFLSSASAPEVPATGPGGPNAPSRKAR